MSPAPGAVIGIDVGGTSVKGAVIAGDHRPTAVRHPTRPAPDPEPGVGPVLRTADDLLDHARATGATVDAVGVACLGVVDETAGIARRSATLGWRDVRIRDHLTSRTGLPVVVGHDVRAAALAEAVLGAGAGHRHVLLGAVGTGFSVAQVVDGQPVTGATWRAGELGQIPVPWIGDPVEAVVSGPGIVARLRSRRGRAPGPATVPGTFAAAAAGDDEARAAVDATARALAWALAVAVATVDPGIVVIGGGVAEGGDVLLDPVRHHLAAALDWRDPPPVVPARFGVDAAWIGAGLLAWRGAGRPDTTFPAGRWA